jgi:hypothetical protein
MYIEKSDPKRVALFFVFNLINSDFARSVFAFILCRTVNINMPGNMIDNESCITPNSSNKS